MKNNNHIPYVVSADIYLLLKKWAYNNYFVLPEKEFFKNLRKEFSAYLLQIFPEFELISEKEISDHLNKASSATGLPCISLDPIYFSGGFSIELTRTVDLQGRDKGLQHRVGSQTLLKQLDYLKSQKINEVCLIDDVIYSGALMERVIKLLSHVKIKVPIVYAGIGIKMGVDRLLCGGREINCLKTYAEVVDEVCERDFYPGIPYSGRSLIGKENVGLPYILPFGNPYEWASIPTERQEDFSEFCLNQVIKLFEEIEKYSDKKISCSIIERKLIGQPIAENYVYYLKSLTPKQIYHV